MKKIVIAIVTVVAAVATGIGALTFKKKTRKFVDVDLDTTTTE